MDIRRLSPLEEHDDEPMRRRWAALQTQTKTKTETKSTAAAAAVFENGSSPLPLPPSSSSPASVAVTDDLSPVPSAFDAVADARAAANASAAAKAAPSLSPGSAAAAAAQGQVAVFPPPLTPRAAAGAALMPSMLPLPSSAMPPAIFSSFSSTGTVEHETMTMAGTEIFGKETRGDVGGGVVVAVEEEIGGRLLQLQTDGGARAPTAPSLHTPPLRASALPAASNGYSLSPTTPGSMSPVRQRTTHATSAVPVRNRARSRRRRNCRLRGGSGDGSVDLVAPDAKADAAEVRGRTTSPNGPRYRNSSASERSSSVGPCAGGSSPWVAPVDVDAPAKGPGAWIVTPGSETSSRSGGIWGFPRNDGVGGRGRRGKSEAAASSGNGTAAAGTATLAERAGLALAMATAVGGTAATAVGGVDGKSDNNGEYAGGVEVVVRDERALELYGAGDGDPADDADFDNLPPLVTPTVCV